MARDTSDRVLLTRFTRSMTSSVLVWETKVKVNVSRLSEKMGPHGGGARGKVPSWAIQSTAGLRTSGNSPNLPY